MKQPLSKDHYRISIFGRPVTNNIEQAYTYHWPQFFKLTTKHLIILPEYDKKIKADLGDYFIRGLISSNGNGGFGIRRDEDLTACCLIIHDIDHAKSFDTPLPTTAEIDRVLEGTPFPYIVYNTAKAERSRIVIAAELYDRDSTDQLTWASYCYLQSLGIPFGWAGESETKSQPWFFRQAVDPELSQVFGRKTGRKFSLDYLKEIGFEPPPYQQKRDRSDSKTETHTEAPEKRDRTTMANTEWFLDQIINHDTLHQAVKSYAGWWRRISNLTVEQIFAEITAQIDTNASEEKKARWRESTERADLERWYQEQDFRSQMQLQKIDFLNGFEMALNLTPTEWLIEGVLEKQALSVMFGEYGSYKSFLALDWALSVATGRPWKGHPVKQGVVFMIIGEGHQGYAKRIRAWADENRIDLEAAMKDGKFHVSKTSVRFLDEASAKECGQRISEIKAQYPGLPIAIWIDTLNRNFGGNENSAEDVSLFIMHLEHYISKDDFIQIVHHPGHNNKERIRGSYALVGAVDAEYRVVLNNAGFDTIEIINKKMKDAPLIEPIYLKPKIRVVDVPDSIAETSVVLELAELPPEVKPIDALKKFIKAHPGIKTDDVVGHCDTLGYKNARTCQSSINRLMKKEGFCEKDGRIYPNKLDE